MRERDDGVRQGRSRKEDRRSSDVDRPEPDLNLLDGFVDGLSLHERHDGEEHGALEGGKRQLLHAACGWSGRLRHTEKGPQRV